MNSTIKNIRSLILATLLGVAFSHGALAESTRYEMRVDGLACPFCAYGIEKKFKAIEGTRNIDVDLDKGLVTVELEGQRRFTDEEMKKLFADSGFTFRSMKTETHE